MRPIYVALALAACTAGPYFGSAALAPATSSAITPVCDPANIQAGALAEPGPVTCPFEPDAVAQALCDAGGWVALLGVVGFATVQDAVDASLVGDTVLVCPGEHDEVVTIDGDRVLAAVDPTPDATILLQPPSFSDATLRGISLDFGEDWDWRNPAPLNPRGDVVLECVTGRGSYGVTATLWHEGPGSVTVRHSTFSATQLSPVIFTRTATVIVEDSEFSDNVGWGGGGGALYVGGDLTVRRSSFLRNRTSDLGNGDAGGDEQGGAIKHLGPTLLVEDSLFEGNANPGDGAGGAIYTEAETVTLAGSTFRDNTAASSGSAISAWGTAGSASLVVTDSTFEGNVTGEASVVLAGEVALDRVSFLDNVQDAEASRHGAPTYGAAVWDVTGGATGTFVGTDVVAQRNSAVDGAVALAGASSAFACTCCDFGSGADDNLPVDLTQDAVAVDEIVTNSSY